MKLMWKYVSQYIQLLQDVLEVEQKARISCESELKQIKSDYVFTKKQLEQYQRDHMSHISQKRALSVTSDYLQPIKHQYDTIN